LTQFLYLDINAQWNLEKKRISCFTNGLFISRWIKRSYFKNN